MPSPLEAALDCETQVRPVEPCDWYKGRSGEDRSRALCVTAVAGDVEEAIEDESEGYVVWLLEVVAEGIAVSHRIEGMMGERRRDGRGKEMQEEKRWARKRKLPRIETKERIRVEVFCFYEPSECERWRHNWT